MDERNRAWLALLVWTGAMVGCLAIDDPRLRFPRFLAFGGLAIGCWLWIARAALTTPMTRATVRSAILLGLLLRCASLLLPPAFSEDVFRYLYEGRLTLELGPAFPFLHAPATAAEAGVPKELLDASWLRINHAELPSIYPPLTQAVFALGAAVGELLGDRLLGMKLLFSFADVLAWALVTFAVGSTGRRPELALVVGLCPVAVLEVSREGHGDSLAMAGLALAALGFVRGRPRLGYLGFGLAALGKLNGLVAAIAALRVERRGAFAMLVALGLLVALPLGVAGPGATTSLVAYGTRWRSGDGAFSLLHTLAELLLGGDWARILGVTITRDALARALSAGCFLLGTWAVLKRSYASEAVPAQATAVLLLLLLLSPTFHPWYALWLLPLAPFAGRWRAPALALLSFAWVAHHASWLELERGTWSELAGARALIHVPVWVLAIRALAQPDVEATSPPGADPHPEARAAGR